MLASLAGVIIALWTELGREGSGDGEKSLEQSSDDAVFTDRFELRAAIVKYLERPVPDDTIGEWSVLY